MAMLQDKFKGEVVHTSKFKSVKENTGNGCSWSVLEPYFTLDPRSLTSLSPTLTPFLLHFSFHTYHFLDCL